MKTKKLKPADFAQQPKHFLELDPVPTEAFEPYVQRHLLMLRHAYTVAEGRIVPAAALSDERIERVFVPLDDESFKDFYKRVRQNAQEYKLTRTFTHAISPVDRRLIGESSNEITNVMLWFAEDSTTGESVNGMLDLGQVDGVHVMLLDDVRFPVDMLSGFLGEAFRTILH